ncbi:unnamed protein product [Amoebophrya sp. A25]|nr:unnamed protein product [Amoebophrya sp. A25]|eukprot:GSA25T00002224001.1
MTETSPLHATERRPAEIRVHEITSLSDLGFPSANIPNTFITGVHEKALDELHGDSDSGVSDIDLESAIVGSTGQVYNKIIKPGDCVLVDIILDCGTEGQVKGGPKQIDEVKKSLSPGSSPSDKRANSPAKRAKNAAVENGKDHVDASNDSKRGGFSESRRPTMPNLDGSQTNEETMATHSGKKSYYSALNRAGPRGILHFRPSQTTAAIVTCGGLCPGLNAVIHHIVNTLWHSYDVRRIMGIRGGFHGMTKFGGEKDFAQDLFGTRPARSGRRASEVSPAHADEALNESGIGQTPTGRDRMFCRSGSIMRLGGNQFDPIRLTPRVVHDIQHLGGTILGATRGGFDIDKISAFIEKNNIDMLFIVGGDGTHRGAYRISQHCIETLKNCAVCGIPKTIDNDIGLIDRSFGFLTAVEEAKKAIRSAKVEAASNMPNGIGIVKLMGRSAGYISALSTISMGSSVDLCLIPEVPVVLEGEKGVLPHLARVLHTRGHAVVVVAEGAGEELMGSAAETDKSGNKKLPAIGEFMTNAIKNYFKKLEEEVTVKYIDPSYMIRSVGPNSLDAYDCMVLSSGAVHGTMAGLTGFTVGMVNNHSCTIPIPLIERLSPRTLNPKGRTWERVLAITHQPVP